MKLEILIRNLEIFQILNLKDLARLSVIRLLIVVWSRIHPQSSASLYRFHHFPVIYWIGRGNDIILIDIVIDVYIYILHLKGLGVTWSTNSYKYCNLFHICITELILNCDLLDSSYSSYLLYIRLSKASIAIMAQDQGIILCTWWWTQTHSYRGICDLRITP